MASRRRRLFLYTRDPRKALTRTRWTSDDSLLFSWWLLVVNSLLNKMFLISQLISFLNLFQEGREGVGLYNKWMQCFCCCHSIHTQSTSVPSMTNPSGWHSLRLCWEIFLEEIRISWRSDVWVKVTTCYVVGCFLLRTLMAANIFFFFSSGE